MAVNITIPYKVASEVYDRSPIKNPAGAGSLIEAKNPASAGLFSNYFFFLEDFLAAFFLGAAFFAPFLAAFFAAFFAMVSCF
jgi:hypothetical protein